MKKRILSLFLSLVMLFSLTTPTAWAAEGDEITVTNGYYNDEGEWVPGGNGTIVYENVDGSGTDLALSKVAEPVAGQPNTFEISLQLQASTPTVLQTSSAATVLVIDTSGSIAYCAECGGEDSHEEDCTHYVSGTNWWDDDNDVTTAQSRMQAAKDVALQFLVSYAGTDASAARWLSIVDFDTNGNVVQDWINVAGGPGQNSYDTAVRKINALSQGGGTNLDDGLYDANAQMNKATVANITSKSVIALTDGAPTYARGDLGNGSSGSAEINAATAATAATLRSNADLYTVCFGVANDYTYTSGGYGGGYGPGSGGPGSGGTITYGPTVGDFLRDSVATPATADKKYAYNADNTTELLDAFRAITEDITEGIELNTVTDPMGSNVTVNEPVSELGEGVSGSANGLEWQLQDVDGDINDGVTTYTYELSYTVTIDANAVGFDEDAWHAANGVTTLAWGDTEYEFPVPGLKGVTSRYTVTYNKGDHGTLAGQDADGNVVHEDIKCNDPTPKAPAVTPDKGYYFVGWDKDIAATVTGNVTYTAVYAEKTEITVTAKSDELVYNGAEQSVSGIEVLGLLDGYKLEGLSASAAGTDVGTYTSRVIGTPVITKDGVDVTEQFTVKAREGKLTITPLPVTVTVTGNEATKEYNGSEQKVEDYTVSISDTLYTEADFTLSGEAVAKGTDKGTYPMGLAVDQFTNNNDNFTVTFVVTDGQLVITPVDVVTVTITGNKDTFTYDGTEQKVEGYTVEISNELYTEADFTFNGTKVVTGTNVGTYPMGLDASQFTNNNTNFTTVNFVVNDGELKINPLAVTVTVTGNTDAKTYNGSEQKVEGYEVAISDKLYTEADFAFSGTDVAAGTNVGTYPMGLAKDQFTNSNDNFDVTFSVTDGELEITPVDEVVVTITGKKGTFTYDGTEKSVSGYTVSIDNDLYTEDDFTFNGEALVKGTDAGTYPMGLAVDQFTNNNTNFASVTFVVNDGELKIDPVDKVTVTITEHSGTETYDSTEKTVSGYDVAISNPLYTKADFAFNGTDVVKGTDVGKYPMDLKASDFVNKNDNFATVEFVIVDGELEITKKAVTVAITGNKDTKVYNGAEQKAEGYTVSISDALYTEADFVFSGEAVAKGTDKGTYPMGLAVDQFSNKNGNFDVTFTVTDGELEITPLTGVVVTITGNTDTKTYNGAEQQVEGYIVSISDKLYTEADFVFSGEAVAKGTDAGLYPMGLAEDQFANKNDNFADVKFEVVDGSLGIKVLPVTVTIVGNTGTKVYTGAEQQVDGYEVTISNTLYTEDYFTFSGTAVAKGTDADTYPMGLAASQFANKNENFSVTFEVTDGELEITPLTGVVVTITGNTDSKVYNGAEQQVEGYTVSINNDLYKEADFTFAGTAVAKGTDVDTYPMGLKDSQFSNTNENFADVVFNVTDGELEITPLAVTVAVTGNKDSKVYNGTEQQVEGYTVTISDALYTEADIAFSGSKVAKGTVVNKYPMGLKVADFSNKNDNFTVTFTVVDGELEITPITAAIVITADSNEKLYDGTPLTDDGFTYTEGVLANGDYITAVVEGSQTDFGSSANKVVSYKVLRGTDAARAIEDVTACYSNITTADGTLSVTKRTVVLTSGSDSKVYDGEPLKVETVTVSGDGFVEGQGAAYSDFASLTNVGSIPNTFSYTLNEGTKAGNYDISVVEGVLTVNKHTNAKLEATGYTGVYDGAMHDSVTDKTVTDAVAGDEWTYTYSTDGETFAAEMPQYQDVGVYTVYVKATNDNYEGDALTTTVTVTITPATVTVTADDHTIATGDADPELTYQVETPVQTETPAFSGALSREEGVAKGEYAINQGTLALADGEGFKAANYELVFVPGKLTILQRSLSVTKTTEQLSVFAGEAITYTIVVTNDGEVDLENVAIVDEMVGLAEVIGALAIGESRTVEVTYTTTDEDIDKTLVNTVVVGAEGETIAEADSEETNVHRPVPKTGDETPVALLGAAMLVSLAGMMVLLLKQRKEQAE